MRLTTYLDFDHVALEHDDRLTLMLELAAPPRATLTTRMPTAVEVVLDRSSSMRGTSLRTAKIALDRLIEWLEPDDRFGLVAFDGEAEVVIPAGPLGDPSAARAAVAALETGAGSALAAGYDRGLSEVGWMLGTRGATVMLISDGHANGDADDLDELSRRALVARDRGVTTTTLALGPDPDRRLLTALAASGVGTALAATEPDRAAALLAGEIDGLLQSAVQSVQLELHQAPCVSSLTVVGDTPNEPIDDGLLIEFGDLNHDERRRVVIEVELDGVTEPGEITVAGVVLSYVTLPSLVPHTFELPLNVVAVPDIQGSRRVADAAVVTEAAFQHVVEATTQIADVHREGGTSPSARALAASAAELERLLAAAPADLRDELAEAISSLDEAVVHGLNLRHEPR
jgi:Ca-activated chloride channel homolog